MTTAVAGLAALLGLTAAAPVLAVEPPLYLRREFVLSSEPPTQSSPREDGEVVLLRRSAARLASFTSAPASTDVIVGDAVASLFLITRRMPLDACAVVSIELYRLRPGDERVPVATASITTSIVHRRLAAEAVVVPLTVNGPLAAPGERIGLDVGVTNECDGPRTVRLLYDSIDEPSQIAFGASPGGVTTTTTVPPGGAATSSSTTTTTTTTTLPGAVPSSCRREPQVGFQRLLCRLDTIDTILRAQPMSALGGLRARKRLFLRLDRARALLAAVAPAGPRPRVMTRGLRATRGFEALVRRGERLGGIEPSLSAEVRGLASDAVDDIRALRGAARRAGDAPAAGSP